MNYGGATQQYTGQTTYGHGQTQSPRLHGSSGGPPYHCYNPACEHVQQFGECIRYKTPCKHADSLMTSSDGYSQSQRPTSHMGVGMGEYQQSRPRHQPLPTDARKKPTRFDTGASSFVPHRGSLPGSYPRNSDPYSNQIQQSQG